MQLKTVDFDTFYKYDAPMELFIEFFAPVTAPP